MILFFYSIITARYFYYKIFVSEMQLAEYPKLNSTSCEKYLVSVCF